MKKEDKQNKEEKGSKPTSISVNISDGETIFVNEFSISHFPTQFFIDFRTVSPRLDLAPNKVMQRRHVRHTVLVLEPYMMKELLGSVEKNIKKYEETFGKLKEPEALKKAKKMAKNREKNEHIEPVTGKPAYFG